MANNVNNSNITVAPTATPASQKKKGSGFVSFDKAADQNKQVSQQLGSQIQNNIGQQVQSAQGQVQNETQNVQGQLSSEANRLGQAGTLVQGLQNNPTQVAKDQYKDLTSGTVKQANTSNLQGMQGALGSAAQVAQQFSSNPYARQEAIQQTVKRPTAMQNLTGVQRNLDSMLLGRNVNTQDMATKTARDAFNLDRSIGSTVRQAGQTGQALQQQAGDVRNQLRQARQSGIESTEKAGADQATAFNAQQDALTKYLHDGQFFTDLSTNEALENPSNMNAMLDVLKKGGLDLSKNLDLTDLGKEGFEGLVKTSFNKAQMDSQQALTNDQRARLKALYNLEDESRDYLNTAYDPASAAFTGSEALSKASADSKALSEKYAQNFENVFNSLVEGSQTGPRPGSALQYINPEEAARIQALANDRYGAGGDFGEKDMMIAEMSRNYLNTDAGKAALRNLLLSGGKDFGVYDNSVDQVFEHIGGGWGAGRGQTLENVQRHANRKPLSFADIYKRNLS